MKHFLLFISICWLTMSVAQSQPERPNIILILLDDLGWSSLSKPMDKKLPGACSDYHETPNIDRLADEGIRFSRGYAPAAICSPTRRSIQFGHTPIRQGDLDFSEHYGPGKVPLAIPQVLKQIDSRYRAAHFGKWDLRAGIFPEDLGYDESDGDTGNSNGNTGIAGDKWTEHFFTGDPKRIGHLTSRAANFMERQVQSGNPFYLQVSHYATHVDMQTREETYAKYAAKAPGKKDHQPAWAGMLENLDQGIGELLQRVKNLGLNRNTYIFLLSDNGATEFIPPVKNRLDHPSKFDQPMRNHPLRGGKWTLYEGGIRVPFMVKGPGIPAGSQVDLPVAGWDFLPTFAELASGKPYVSDQLDGVSLVQVLKNPGNSELQRRDHSFYFHRYNNGYPHSAIIEGNYKLIRFWKTGKAELYNLPGDPGELNDLCQKEPQTAERLGRKLEQYLKQHNPDLLNLAAK